MERVQAWTPPGERGWWTRWLTADDSVDARAAVCEFRNLHHDCAGATPSCESVLRLWTEGRQPPLHLQKHQPGHPGAEAAGPVVPSSSTIDSVLAPQRRPRSRKLPNFSSHSRFTVINWHQRRGIAAGSPWLQSPWLRKSTRLLAAQGSLCNRE
jgi:hypothetical protein